MSQLLQTAFAQLTKQGFVERSAQQAMAQLVADAITHKTIAVIEGGTGIGKTFGYLIPALLNLPKGKKLVVATATVNLQHQLIEKDFPEVLKAFDQAYSAQIAKGRRRYVCAQRLHQLVRNDVSQSELSLFGIDASSNSQHDQELATELAKEYHAETWDGDRDHLKESVTDKFWQQITTDAAGCSNRQCDFFSQCAYFKAKKHMAQADVIITNHDLLLTDILHGTGFVLPKAEDCVYIIDEAHHFPHKAVQHFTASSQLLSQHDWLERAGKIVAQLQEPIHLASELTESLTALCDELKSQMQAIHEFVQANFPAGSDEWLLSDVPEVLLAQANAAQSSASKLLNALASVRQQLNEQHNTQTLPEFERYLGVLGFYLQRAEHLWRTWQLFCKPDPETGSPIARWFSAIDNKMNPSLQDYVCSAALISSADVLVSMFWQKRQEAMILCSATLRAMGRFDSFLLKAGLANDPDVQTAAYASPFKYEASKLHIPNLKVLPKGANQQAFSRAVCEYLPSILKQQTAGCLVLFTSRLLMQDAYAALPDELVDLVLVQEHLPKHRLIAKHKQRVDEGRPSVIFGLQSFAEGVDLPGKYCQHLIIAKLPFAVPTTPIERRYSDWLTQQGRDPFKEHSLPEASIRLAQYAGRLIRTEADRGQITILDRRLIERHYGKQLIASLPPFELVVE